MKAIYLQYFHKQIMRFLVEITVIHSEEHMSNNLCVLLLAVMCHVIPFTVN